MNITVFNRYEKKFVISDEVYRQIIERISEYMVPDSHSKDGGIYSICNIYYDTEDDYLIRRSIDKPIYKEKIRLRSYGVPDLNSEAFIEIKKKFKGNVNKRRITLPLHEAMDYLNNDIKPPSIPCNSQIFREIEYMRQRYVLVPKLYLSYDRRAYFGKADKSLRITFDRNITTRREDLNLQSGSYGQKILPKNYWIMEIKVPEAIPMWLTNILSELKVYKTSFSKYGTEYKGYVQNNLSKGDKIICLNQLSRQQKPQ